MTTWNPRLNAAGIEDFDIWKRNPRPTPWDDTDQEAAGRQEGCGESWNIPEGILFGFPGGEL